MEDWKNIKELNKKIENIYLEIYLFKKKIINNITIMENNYRSLLVGFVSGISAAVLQIPGYSRCTISGHLHLYLFIWICWNISIFPEYWTRFPSNFSSVFDAQNVRVWKIFTSIFRRKKKSWLFCPIFSEI